MARQDIAGLLTGMPSNRPDPMGMSGNSEQQRLAFGAQRAQGMQRGLRSAMGQGPTTAEQLQMAMAKLDLSKPEDLRKLASIQQATGDLAGAAQTASRIQTMKQAAITEDRAARNMEIKEETFEMQKAASGRQLDLEEAQLAQQGVSRALLVERATGMGRSELANLIKTGAISLEKATTMLFPSSSAAVKAPTKDEKSAFDVVLESEDFKDKIESLETGMWFWKGLDESDKNLIYLKAKEYRVREGLRTEDALAKAIEDLKNLDIPMGGGGTNNTTGTTPKAVDNVLQDLSQEATTPPPSSARNRQRRREDLKNMLQDTSPFAELN